MITHWQDKDMWWLKQSSPIENTTNYRVSQRDQNAFQFYILNHFTQAYAVLDTLPPLLLTLDNSVF